MCALDILFGSMPLKGKEKDAVKEGILAILKEKYDIEEEDFLSAELFFFSKAEEYAGSYAALTSEDSILELLKVLRNLSSENCPIRSKILSMHAPWEVTSKADIYEAKKGYMAFLKEA